MLAMKYNTKDTIIISLNGKWENESLKDITYLFNESLFENEKKVLIDISTTLDLNSDAVSLVKRFKQLLKKQNRDLQCI